jgi:8-amino-7-oxononanoate synthase
MKILYKKILQTLKEKNLYRSLTPCDNTSTNSIQRKGKTLISFASNDYLSLSQNPEVKKAAITAIEKFGCGSTSSRYISGNNSLHQKLESEIANFKNCEDALMFSSGYSAAIGMIPALVGEGDLIVADRLIHSSLIDGSKLSGARLMRFLHNDVAHARKILSENRAKFKKCLIITETIFSMDGDLGEVEELLKLAEEFEAILVSDAAHDLFLGVGPSHEDGVTESGGHSETKTSHSETKTSHPEPKTSHPELVEGCENHTPTHLKIGTFSKALGSLGGYIAGDAILIDYLRNFAKSQIYSTALPPATLAASLTALKVAVATNPGAQTLKNANYFCELMSLPKAESAIVPIILGDAKKVLEIAAAVEKEGMLISAIRPPTVEKGKSRLRISFSATHSEKQIEKLAETLKKLGVNFR